MKNPFDCEVRAVEVSIINPLTEGEFSLYWLRKPDEQPIGMTEEQATFAAHAINQHEKFVAMLRQLEWSDHLHDGEAVCPCCQASVTRGHFQGCELKALLAEEGEATMTIKPYAVHVDKDTKEELVAWMDTMGWVPKKEGE